MEPNFSPKIEAYITVLSKIQDLKLKRGLYPAEYTRQVNLEIDGIRKRLIHFEAIPWRCYHIIVQAQADSIFGAFP